MSEFDIGTLMPLITGVVGLAIGFALPYFKGIVMKTENKLDDAVWNRLVNEFTAAGVITQEELDKLRNQPVE